MTELIARFGDAVKGVITGFDRIVLKGSILSLSYADGAMQFCGRRGILNKDYKSWMTSQSTVLVERADRYARRVRGRGVTYIPSLHTSKENLARERQRTDGIEKGLIGVWSCLESARSFKAHFCAERGFPQLRYDRPNCRHLYFYFDHPEFGFMNVRLQTWFPYPIQICMNGREWLRRSLETENVGFDVHRNKFLHISDYERAQQLLDRQLDSKWPELLSGFLPTVFPTMEHTLGAHFSYYWTMWQSEWATDLLFQRPEDLRPIMGRLLTHALSTGTSERVLRYLGRPVTVHGNPHRNFRGQVTSRASSFHEGVRVRHWVDHNSVKVYNEQNVLRLETTINDPKAFRVHRRARSEPADAPKKLRPLRKGVADIPLRAQLSHDANKRFAQHLATFSDDTPVFQVFADLTRGRTRQGRRVRALVPVGKDYDLLHAIADPAFTVSGMTNPKLRQVLRGTSWAAGRTEKQLSARVSRHLRLLRDHGLIRKIPNRRSYLLTPKGQQITAALHAMLASSTQKLMEMAA